MQYFGFSVPIFFYFLKANKPHFLWFLKPRVPFIQHPERGHTLCRTPVSEALEDYVEGQEARQLYENLPAITGHYHVHNLQALGV